MKRFTVTVTIDRPKGYQDKYGNVYPISYGFVSGVVAGDGEGQDVYILTRGTAPDKTFTGEIIAVVLRSDDVEDKWVIADAGASWTVGEITQVIAFIEQYFDSKVVLLESIR